MDEQKIIEIRNLKKISKNNIVNIVHDAINKNKQVLVFNNSKNSSEKTAIEIANYITPKINNEELLSLSKKILKIIPTPTKQCYSLSKVIEKGIAFHHSGLLPKQRSLIEKAFKEGLIKVISSTPTLAAGLNLPAYKVIIKDYKRYSSRGFADIPVLEFHQMSGRAGRPGQENVGKAVINVKTQDELQRIVPKYIFGKAEEIISKLAIEPTLKMHLLSLISMDLINTKKEIFDFFASTLYAYQYKDTEQFNFNLLKILEQLKDYKFIEQEDNYYMASPIGKKISQLYLNPDTAHYFYKNIEKFIEKFSMKNYNKQEIYSLIFFICDTMEMKPTFTVYKAEESIYMKRAEEIVDSLVVEFDPYETDYETFLKNIKTSDLLMDWIEEAHEDFLNEKYKVTPGELRYKLEIVDWLLYCLEEISLMKKNFYFKNILSKLRIRFEKGIKEELLPLINLKGIGRSRARKLYNADLKKILDLKKTSFEYLSKTIGESIAIKIKKQIDENFIQIPNVLEIEKPIQIKKREVSDEEIEILLENDKKFEEEKKESQKGLLGYF